MLLKKMKMAVFISLIGTVFGLAGCGGGAYRETDRVEVQAATILPFLGNPQLLKLKDTDLPTTANAWTDKRFNWARTQVFDAHQVVNESEFPARVWLETDTLLNLQSYFHESENDTQGNLKWFDTALFDGFLTLHLVEIYDVNDNLLSKIELKKGKKSFFEVKPWQVIQVKWMIALASHDWNTEARSCPSVRENHGYRMSMCLTNMLVGVLNRSIEVTTSQVDLNQDPENTDRKVLFKQDKEELVLNLNDPANPRRSYVFSPDQLKVPSGVQGTRYVRGCVSSGVQ